MIVKYNQKIGRTTSFKLPYKKKKMNEDGNPMSQAVRLDIFRLYLFLNKAQTSKEDFYIQF